MAGHAKFLLGKGYTCFEPKMTGHFESLDADADRLEAILDALPQRALVIADRGMDYPLRIKDRPVAEGGAVRRKGRLVMPDGPGLGLEKLVRRLSRRG